MAYNLKSLLPFLLLLAIAGHAVSGREIPTDTKNTDTKKQPEFFIDKDGSYLVPGIGRFMLPHKGIGFNPFTYNPVTGTNGGVPTIGSGTGGDIGSGSGVGTPGNDIPGGDDTLVPNPGVEVPIPGSGGSTPAAAARP